MTSMAICLHRAGRDLGDIVREQLGFGLHSCLKLADQGGIRRQLRIQCPQCIDKAAQFRAGAGINIGNDGTHSAGKGSAESSGGFRNRCRCVNRAFDVE